MARQKGGTSEIFLSIKRVIVVPVEPPPLIISPSILEALGDVPIISGYPPEGGAVLTLISGIVVLSQLSKYEERRENVLKLLNEWNASDQTWIPTRALAQEAANQILESRNYDVVVRQELYAPPSLSKKEITWHMENWYAPLREWYNQDIPALKPEDYRRQDIDTALEIGIINYELHRGHLLIQVLTKLITISTGRVEARARSYEDVEIGPPEKLFQNEAYEFKQIFVREGKKLLKDNFRKIGLLPE